MPQIVAIGMVRELGPVLVGLMIAARVTSSIAAEIATMKVTEQIDALVTLSTHPMKFLTVPRVLAGLIMVPLLVGIGDIIGILGGFIVGVNSLGFNAATYLHNTVNFHRGARHHLVAGQGRGLRLHRDADGLLLRHEHRARRAGRGARHQGRGRGRRSADPRRQLPSHQHLLHDMIQLDNVHKAFGSKKVLQGVNLTIPSGTSMVIIGGSGTGKSVALKCVLGLIRPDSGLITLDGKDVTKGDRDAFLARFGMLFQGGALFDSLPVWQNVAFRLLRGSLKRPKAEAREIAIEKLRRVGLKAELPTCFRPNCRAACRNRVGLARAIAAEPEIIFFDEPTTGSIRSCRA